MVRICIRGNLPKCSEVKKPAEAASSVMWDVTSSKVMKTPMAPPSRLRVPTRSRMSPDLRWPLLTWTMTRFAQESDRKRGIGSIARSKHHAREFADIVFGGILIGI